MSFPLCRARAALAAAGLFAGAPTAFAQMSPALDRFSLSVGAFAAEPRFETSVRTELGTLGSGELKNGHVTMPRISADLMIGDNHGLSFDYYRFKRDYGTGGISNLVLGPTSLNAVGNLNFNLRFDFAKLAYRWWLGSGDTVLGLGAGAAYYRVKLDTRAYASLGGFSGLSGSFNRSDSDDAIAPLLEVGLRHAITPDLRLFADLSGMRKGGSRFRGNIYNAAAGVEWFPAKNVGVALSYGVTSIDLRREGSGFIDGARVKLKLQGPTLALKARF